MLTLTLNELLELRNKFINDPEMKAHYEYLISEYDNCVDDDVLPQD